MAMVTKGRSVLVVWSEWHALVVAAGFILALSGLPLSYFAILVLVSFLSLIIRWRPQWVT